MDQSSHETSGLSLPPVQEQLPQAGSETNTQVPEQLPTAAEQAPARAQQAPAALPVLPMPLPLNPASDTTQNDVSKTSDSTAKDVSDDGDLIEKEWVDKAKQIVERTRDNPYQQSEELTVFRADYMKKRYDKTIKLSK